MSFFSLYIIVSLGALVPAVPGFNYELLYSTMLHLTGPIILYFLYDGLYW